MSVRLMLLQNGQRTQSIFENPFGFFAAVLSSQLGALRSGRPISCRAELRLHRINHLRSCAAAERWLETMVFGEPALSAHSEKPEHVVPSKKWNVEKRES
jgi:hypothetical protein